MDKDEDRMAEIQLHGVNARGRVALVDDADLELVSGYRWTVQEYQTPGGYVQGPYARSWGWRDGRKTMIFMHQLIAGMWADHADGNGLDNRRSTNLRQATMSQNNANKGKLTHMLGKPVSSRFIGVSWNTAIGKWKAAVREGGKVKHLGFFEDEQQAAMVRDQAAIRVFGEFARLNFSERMTTEGMEDDQDRGSETFCSVCGPLDEPGVHNQSDCPRGHQPPERRGGVMATIGSPAGTFSQWLDSYDGPDNIVAGVARIWRDAKGDRPRASAVQTISQWLTDQHKVHEDAMRASVRSYHEARGGRQATEAEVGAFRAMNSPGTIAPVPGDHEQPAGPSPAVMAVLGRIESMLAQVQEQNLELLAWTKLQDERIKPITDLLGELADAESAPEPDPAYLDELAHQSAEEAQADADPDGPGQPWQHGPDGLWGNIMAPEPDPERMAQLGDPRLVEEEG